MQLHHTYLIPALALSKAGILKHLIRAPLRHREPDHVHRTPSLEGFRRVRGQCLGYDLDGLVLEFVCVDEGFGGDDAAGSAVLFGKATGQIPC